MSDTIDAAIEWARAYRRRRDLLRVNAAATQRSEAEVNLKATTERLLVAVENEAREQGVEL